MEEEGVRGVSIGAVDTNGLEGAGEEAAEADGVGAVEADGVGARGAAGIGRETWGVVMTLLLKTSGGTSRRLIDASVG